jgi:DNA-binding transcriptional ArsR family regulator
MYDAFMPKQVDCAPILKALADATRWQIVRELLDATLTVKELTERVDATQYNVSKHLRILREAGIVRTQKDGKHVRCSVEEEFRLKMTQKRDQLDLGCCTFRF